MRTPFKTLLTVLLLLQMAAINAVPPGVHLNLCFGTDGHFDLSREICTGSAATPCSRPESSLITEHHDDCLDLAAGCGASAYFLHLSDKGRHARDTALHPAPMPATAPCLPSFLLSSTSSSRPRPSPEDGRFISAVLDALRTTVLLI
ncbi:MAG: hypothetical protein AB1568_12780 [Thermodesulfobacteriota bacterium]